MKLKFGMVGGGNGAFIGNVHRKGAIADDLAELAAGCFTRNWEKNLETAEKWGVKDQERVYKSWKDMADGEEKREDRIDFVIIVTPTYSHYEIAKYFMEKGFHVVCDKPICLSTEEGLELERIAKEKNLLFGVTYTYAAYAIIRQGREMVERGELGQILKIEAEYPQDWVLEQVVSGQSDQNAWRLDPALAGPSACCADIGTHVEALIGRMTGLHPKRVLARLNHLYGSLLEHDIDVMLEFEGNIPGRLWASQYAAGNDCAVKIRVFGDKGSLEWKHTDPMRMIYTPLLEAPRLLTANKRFNYRPCLDQCRLPAGHPEGFYEAFGNVYRAFCLDLLEKYGRAERGDFSYPTIEDGIWGLKFVDACLESDTKGNIWVDIN